MLGKFHLHVVWHVRDSGLGCGHSDWVAVVLFHPQTKDAKNKTNPRSIQHVSILRCSENPTFISSDSLKHRGREGGREEVGLMFWEQPYVCWTTAARSTEEVEESIHIKPKDVSLKQLVCWCCKSSQPQRIISGPRQTFFFFYRDI